jgi:hypothetical protein
MTGSIGILGWFVLPRDRLKEQEKPKLDVLGAGLSTGGLILLSFVLSSGGHLRLEQSIRHRSAGRLGRILGHLHLGRDESQQPDHAAFAVEAEELRRALDRRLRHVRRLPDLHLLHHPHRAGGRTPRRQRHHDPLSAHRPHGLHVFAAHGPCCRDVQCQTPTSYGHDAVCRCARVRYYHDGWGTTIVYCIITVVLLGSVPTNVKSLCGGMVNPAFQIGSGVGLALSSAVVQAVDTSRGHSKMKQYETGLLCCVGLGLVGFMSALGVRDAGKVKRGREST